MSTRLLLVSLLALVLVPIPVSPALAADALAADAVVTALPPVALVFTCDVIEPDGWFEMHQEILDTPPQSQKALLVTIPTVGRASRAIILLTPRFSTTIRRTGGSVVMRLLVKGMVSGEYAQQTLLPFVNTFVETRAESDPRVVTLQYGLAALTANLVELKLEER
jgi:hypothetical protein